MNLDSDRILPVKALGVFWLANDNVFAFKSQVSERTTILLLKEVF